MTAYFDAMQGQIRYILNRNDHRLALLEALDRELTWDVTLAAEMPDFPVDLRAKIDAIVLGQSLLGCPVVRKGADYGTDEEYASGLRTMVDDLHTVFHELARRDLPNFNDNPRTPLSVLYSRAEERRERMLASQGGT